MNTIKTLTLTAVLLAAGLSPTWAEVHVFACEPEWAALAQEIGGQKTSVFTATTAGQDPHHIRARPSLIARIRRARLLVCSGGGLEVGWLPILLQRGASATVQPGAIGWLMATDYLPILEKPTVIDRAQGDVHPEGNPHVHLDPRNIERLAVEIARRLTIIDAPHAGHYAARLAAFQKRWKTSMDGWTARAHRLASMPVIVHHKSWSYLINWIGLKEVSTLEPKPGLPPTASHLEYLLRLARNQPVKAIIRTPYDSPTASAWLAERAGVPALMLPYTVGGDDKTHDLTALFERTLTLLEQANDQR
jgi:zinc/manganese transport system substrate-binding protein